MTAAFIPLIFLVLLPFVGRRLSGSYLAPGVFFAAYWTVMTAAPMLLAPRFEVSPAAVWWILLSVLCLLLGSLIGEYLGRTVARRQPTWTPRQTGALQVSVVVASVLGFFVVVAHLYPAGYSLAVFTSLDAVASVGRSFSIARYHDHYTGPLIARVLLVPLYLSAMLGGWLAAAADTRRARLISILPVIPALGVLAILTTKASLLTTMGLWTGAYLSFFVWQGRRLREIVTPGSMLKGIIGLVAVFVVFFASFMIRYGFRDFRYFGLVWERMEIYAFGHISAFSYWIEEYGMDSGEAGLGAYTFAGVLDMLGIAKRAQGIHDHHAIIDYGADTNVYTFYRGLITDFTAQGSLVVLVLVGIVAGVCFVAAKRGRFVAAGALTIFYTFTLWSFAVSTLNYNSILLACVLLNVFGLWLRLSVPRRGLSASSLSNPYA